MRDLRLQQRPTYTEQTESWTEQKCLPIRFSGNAVQSNYMQLSTKRWLLSKVEKMGFAPGGDGWNVQQGSRTALEKVSSA